MKKDSFEKKLAAYVALSAAYLVAHPVDANAQVMYTDVMPDLVINNGFFNLDLNNDGVVDFKLQNTHDFNSVSWGQSSGCVTNSNTDYAFCLGLNKIAIENSNSYCNGNPKPFIAGISIGSQYTFGNANLLNHEMHQSCWTSSNSYGSNTTNSGCFFWQDKYLGLKMKLNGNTYYGWARLNIGSVGIITLKDYAVNLTPDSSIITGNTNGCAVSNYNLTPNGNQVYCTNDSLTVTLHNATGQAIQWLKNGSWITGETDSLYAIHQNGDYQALIFDSTCSVIATGVHTETEHFNIDQISTSDETCNGVNGSAYVVISGNSPGYHFSWSTGATTQGLSGIAGGIYNVTVSSALCPDTATAGEVIYNTPGPTLTETHTYSACNSNGSINLSVNGGTPPYTYHWSNFYSSQDLNNIQPGTYSVTVLDHASCAAYVTVLIYNSGISLSQIHSSTCDSSAFIDLTVNTGTPPYSYLWNNGAVQQDLNNLPQGNYSVTVTDFNGCTTTLATAISAGSVPNPIVYLTGNILNTSSGFLSYQWFLNNLPIAGANSYQYTPLQTGLYKVEAFDTVGCSGYSLDFYFEPLSVNGLEGDVQWTVTVDKNKNLLFHLADNTLIGAQIDIVNELGQLAASVTVTNQTPSADLSALPGGIYFYHIRSKQKTYSGKFIIE